MLLRCAALPSGVFWYRVPVFHLFPVWFAVWFWSAWPCAVLCCVSLGAVRRRAAPRCAARCCAVVCCVVLMRLLGVVACSSVPSGAARRPGALCFAAPCFAVFHCAVCFMLCVSCRGVLVRAVVRRCAFVLCVSWGCSNSNSPQIRTNSWTAPKLNSQLQIRTLPDSLGWIHRHLQLTF